MQSTHTTQHIVFHHHNPVFPAPKGTEWWSVHNWLFTWGPFSTDRIGHHTPNRKKTTSSQHPFNSDPQPSLQQEDTPVDTLPGGLKREKMCSGDNHVTHICLWGQEQKQGAAGRPAKSKGFGPLEPTPNRAVENHQDRQSAIRKTDLDLKWHGTAETDRTPPLALISLQMRGRWGCGRWLGTTPGGHRECLWRIRDKQTSTGIVKITPCPTTVGRRGRAKKRSSVESPRGNAGTKWDSEKPTALNWMVGWKSELGLIRHKDILSRLDNLLFFIIHITRTVCSLAAPRNANSGDDENWPPTCGRAILDESRCSGIVVWG